MKAYNTLEGAACINKWTLLSGRRAILRATIWR